jgi:hypothetical protein
MIALLGAAPVADVEALAPADYRQDARSIEVIVNAHYSYLDRFTGAHMPVSPALRAEAERVHDRRSLLRFAERHRGPLTVRVGRWTGSMGEGLAIGFDALGAKVVGTHMAGLLGAIYDFRLERSGLVIKLPAERLLAVDGTPRERFVPKSVGKSR